MTIQQYEYITHLFIIHGTCGDYVFCFPVVLSFIGFVEHIQESRIPKVHPALSFSCEAPNSQQLVGSLLQRLPQVMPAMAWN